MTRARATALVLVNWKGVFYERYLLDRHVTSLEGANGAGKTTVMIAAYVVLLPDMSRLRFTNLGETAATGGDRGIWGRLGDPGRPSYAAIELDLGEEGRLVIGVHLERKAEPSVEPKAFIVTSLSPEARLQDLFLRKVDDDELIPDLKELAESARSLGAELEVFRSTKEYFASLFDRGVSPLRLATEEDRNKLNEMLRTSMTGGISRALTSELRTFLLREEPGLSDALSRMRANLDTCRRTRTEVLEAQRLEREIASVYEGGQELLNLALRAAQARLTELSRAAHDAASRRSRAEETLALHERELDSATARQRALAEELDQLRQAQAEAAKAHERAVRARELQGRIQKLEVEEQRIALELARAEDARRGAEKERERTRRARAEAQSSLALAAAGLARLQQGTAELHRRALLHKTTREQLALARSALHVPNLDADEAHAYLVDARGRLKELDGQRASRARELETAVIRRTEFQVAFTALLQLAPDAPPHEAFARARAELGRLNELENLVQRLPELEREQERRTRTSVKRAALLERASGLGVALEGQDAIATLTQVWSAAEADLSRAEQATRDEELALRDLHAELDALVRQRTVATATCARYDELTTRLERLADALEEKSLDASSLPRVRDALANKAEAARRRAAQLITEREAAREQATRLELGGETVSPELARLADAIDGELIARRFEDVEPEAAAELEAVLGPLAEAVIVEDPVAAARALAGEARDVREIWLISPDAVTRKVEHRASLSNNDPDVIVHEDGAVRVARKPQVPKLGRRARMLAAQAERQRVEQLGAEVERVRQGLASTESLLRETERASTAAASFADGDPHDELQELDAAIARSGATKAATEARLERAREQERFLRSRVHGLRALVSESHGALDRDDGASNSDLLERLNQARAGLETLRRCSAARQRLSETVESLRSLPIADERIEAYQREAQSLEETRDELYRAVEALEYVLEHRAALGWEEAERALDAQAELAPTLEAQHSQSVLELETAERAVERADAEWDARTNDFQRIRAEHLALSASKTREQEELAALIPHAQTGSDQSLDERLGTLDERLTALTRDERAASLEAARIAERRDRARRELDELERAAERLRESARPLDESWRGLVQRAEALGAVIVHEEPRGLRARTSAELWAETRGKRAVLLERIERTRGGRDLAIAVREQLDPRPEDPEAYLSVWSLVREWLLRCLPTPIAESAEPIKAIDGLRAELAVLEERLTRQEADLRGTSEDVARSIDVQIRRAQNQVRRLNQHLTGIGFGSIRGIRIRSARIERMDQVLKALREGGTQELLFQPNMPIEDALNEIFKRHAGGKSGGHRLLDYREYLELTVEVTRQEDGSFENAHPTRLSTGEAIGVGAALMMVVLTEWERDANLFRGKKPVASLRFLFLDEANRLSQDNLGVLFDLCRTLDLQLLIAAPEVARAEGNTTYRLVRRTSEDGRDEVIVSGRRGIAVATS